jgi:hypothetical protein
MILQLLKVSAEDDHLLTRQQFWRPCTMQAVTCTVDSLVTHDTQRDNCTAYVKKLVQAKRKINPGFYDS